MVEREVPSAEAPVSLRLRLGRDRVSLVRRGRLEAEHQPRGLGVGTDLRLWQLDRLRRGRPGELQAALLELGAVLTRGFLDGPPAEALEQAVREAERRSLPVELGLEVEDDLADLPWEILRRPGFGGEPGPPLALHPQVRLFRTLTAPPIAAPGVPGALRILVAVGSPEEQNERGELLDMERELARILDAVEPTRRESRPAHVRVLERGTVAAIREALAAEPWHVLHISCHARPGLLILEDEDGRADRVDADRLFQEALAASRGNPFIVLAGCATALAQKGSAALPGLARQLLAYGVPGVLAMQAPVSDAYASELCARFYRSLTTAEHPDPLAALSDARRALESERDTAVAPEWATPALYLPKPPAEPRLTGLVVRPVGDFVGRRREARRLRNALSAATAGVLVHGLGGVGKSSLVAEALQRAAADGWLVASLRGEVEPDTILAEVSHCLLASLADADPRRQLASAIGRPDLDWEGRLDLLAAWLRGLRLLVLLDEFEENLEESKLRNEDLAGMLARWLADPGLGRLLFTSRHPFELPRDAHRNLEVLHLGPLSPAETRKLMWRLPGLDALEPKEKLEAHAAVGGHPRTLEYLDALLRGGEARFQDVADRMTETLEQRGVGDPRAWMETAEGDFGRALAEAVTLASDDVLLGRLLERVDRVPLARELLTGASVYRIPVDLLGLEWQVGEVFEVTGDPEAGERLDRLGEEIARAQGRGEEPASELMKQFLEERAAWARPPLRVPAALEPARRALESLGLLAPVDLTETSLYTVHRWTASAVLARSAADEVRQAHQRAARYWRWRGERLSDRRSEIVAQLLEARYHHLRAGEVESAVEVVTDWVGAELHAQGAYRRVEQLCRETLAWVPERSPEAAALVGQLGLVAQARGDFERALDRYQRSLDLSRSLGDLRGVAGSQHQIGTIHLSRGEHAQAEEAYRASLRSSEELGDRAGMAHSLHQLGIVAQEQGDWDHAFTSFQESLRIQEERGDLGAMIPTLFHLGRIAHLRGDVGTAADLYQRSMRISASLGNRPMLAETWHQLGVLAHEQGDLAGALEHYKKAFRLKEELGMQESLAGTCHQLALVAQAYGDPAEARRWRERELRIHEELGGSP